MAPARTKKLTKPEVESLIQGLLQSGSINHDALLAFAEKINGSAFKNLKKPKVKAMTMTAAKKAVLDKFNCKSIHIPDQKGNYKLTLRENDDLIDELGWLPKDRLKQHIESI